MKKALHLLLISSLTIKIIKSPQHLTVLGTWKNFVFYLGDIGYEYTIYFSISEIYFHNYFKDFVIGNLPA